MSNKKIYYLLICVLVVVCGLGVGGVYFGNQLLVSSSTKLNDAKLDTKVIDEQQKQLATAKQDISKYSDLETIAKTVVPQEKDQARTVREIVKFAADTNVSITSVTFPSSDLSSDTTTKKTNDPNLSQLQAVQGIKGVYILPITISNDVNKPVSYANLIKFLEKLEQNRRTSEVNSIGLTPNPVNRNLLTYTMTINVYIKP